MEKIIKLIIFLLIALALVSIAIRIAAPKKYCAIAMSVGTVKDIPAYCLKSVVDGYFK